VAETDDRVDHDPERDHDQVQDEHRRDSPRLAASPDERLRAAGARCRAERVEPFRERRGHRLLDRRRLAVAPREEALPEAGERLLALGDVRRVAVEPFGRRLLPFLLAPKAPLTRLGVLEPLGDIGVARRYELLSLRERPLRLRGALLARGDLFLPRCDGGLSPAELLAKRGRLLVKTGGLGVARVELHLATEQVLASPVELGRPGVQLGGMPLHVRFAAREAHLTADELRFLPLLTALEELGVGDPRTEREEPLLAVAPRPHPAGDPVNPLLEALLALGELPLALGQAARRSGQLALRLRQILERLRAIALPLFDLFPVEQYRPLTREENVAPVVVNP
jgi:hypothetical protein